MITIRQFFFGMVILYSNIAQPDVIYTNCSYIHEALVSFGLDFVEDADDIMPRMARNLSKKIFINYIVNHTLLPKYKEYRQTEWDLFFQEDQPTLRSFYRALGFEVSEAAYRRYNKSSPLFYYLNHRIKGDLSTILSQQRAPVSIEEGLRFYEVIVAYIWDQLRKDGDIQAFSVMIKTIGGDWSVCVQKQSGTWRERILAARAEITV